jgi:hypothetical protein
MVNNHHGQTEVWSNQYAKWVLMDAELNAHYVKDAVPLNMLELFELGHRIRQAGIKVIQTPQRSGDPSTTLAHLKIDKLKPEIIFDISLANTFEIVEMRNDWMTNHYCWGHPRRSDQNSLVYDPPGKSFPPRYEKLMRPVTSRSEDLYWTLNQTELWAKMGTSTQEILLEFKTVTPNYSHFEVRVDAQPVAIVKDSRSTWSLHTGGNKLRVRAVNRFGVKGPESSVVVRLVK